ncbi:plasmid pRiA4b ORF-3 family protein [Sphingomonas echinoides]|uniref:Plasmid pRiA4b ORF-3 family protein n=1 Tax=Sphingomonas echinoides TaxID=59803 RepID=A0ABU4PM15_9SPHN|nr:plasmid pRiA4b ORF-3 family protein [Sphingomonas echinoides]MDX5985218.1 plasmid pRiA4b ORF-3 family protein [Sphingomonas echinoides]
MLYAHEFRPRNEGRVIGTKRALSRNGGRRAPREDARRTPRFENFLNTIADPKHPEHAEATEWHFGCYGNAFARSCFDELAAKLRRSDIAKRRAADEATFAERKSTCQGVLQTALTSRIGRKPQKKGEKTASGGPETVWYV